MNSLYLKITAFDEDFDWEEDFGKDQISFTAPKELTEQGTGEEFHFSNNGKNTYLSISGCMPSNAPPFKAEGLFSDFELYEIVYELFKFELLSIEVISCQERSRTAK